MRQSCKLIGTHWSWIKLDKVQKKFDFEQVRILINSKKYYLYLLAIEAQFVTYFFASYCKLEKLVTYKRLLNSEFLFSILQNLTIIYDCILYSLTFIFILF